MTQPNFSMDPAIIDVAALQNATQKEIYSFLLEGWNEIQDANHQRVKEAFSSGTLKENVPSHISAYCPVHSFCVSNLIGRGKTSVSPFLLIHVYLATHYQDISCHYLLFGMNKAVQPMGRAELFLTYFDKLSHQDRIAMVRYLEENRLSTNNPSFILKERCEELAFSQGMPLRSFLVFPYVSSIVGKKTIRFSQETIPATLDTSKASYIWNNNSISARLAYFICTLYNISADFLFLQDYSDRVVWKGEALSADLQTSFSAFLCATKSAQDVAIQNLVQFLLRY